MYPISVCMIVKNEEDHIEECLKRLRPCRFELVVVDTGSTDRTMELAAQYTSNLYQFSWCDDFSAARNYSISKASNDWVLVIDCDEYLENVHLLNLEAAMKDNPEGLGEILRNNPYQIQGNRSIMSDRIGRLFNRRIYHYEGTIHEQVSRMDKQEPQTFELPLTVYHEGYVTESGKRRRAARNLEMLLNDLPRKGMNPYICYQLGQNYIQLNDTEKAIESFEQGLELHAGRESSLGRNLVEAYGYALLESGHMENSLSLERYYDTYREHADYIFLMGLVYQANGMLDKAYAEFEKALTLQKGSRKGTNSYRAYYQMGQILEQKGDMANAILTYKKCGDYEPAVKHLLDLQ